MKLLFIVFNYKQKNLDLSEYVIHYTDKCVLLFKYFSLPMYMYIFYIESLNIRF